MNISSNLGVRDEVSSEWRIRTLPLLWGGETLRDADPQRHTDTQDAERLDIPATETRGRRVGRKLERGGGIEMFKGR